jgi:ribosomal protein S18 acetylase RimI-like enzyme
MGVTSVAASPHVRPVERDDRDRIQAIVVATGHFTQIEADTALELVDASLAGGEVSGYLTYVLESPPGMVQGYVCIGPTPLTDGTFDLYWVAVDPAAQGRGYGRRLLATAEAEVRARGGRLVIIETSSQEIYRPTVGFYESAGYRLVARIPNFYRPGDDKLVFSRDIAPA